jgi:radical SAM protein with 4Fe4S-binding SPASM domain
MSRHTDIDDHFSPRYVVWELTLKCDLACRHCGSRAGRPREEELSLAESLDVLQQLKDLGTREITFIGGEAYLYPEWLEVIEACSNLGIRPTMTTGGRNLDVQTCKKMKDAGMSGISISVDGLQNTHDQLRAVKGSFASALQSFANCKQVGIPIFANTQINQLNKDELSDLGHLFADIGIKEWQVQITGPMGRAADRPEWLLQPYDMLDLFPMLAQIAEEHHDVFHINLANNLGYFGPYEYILRASHWKGCVAGKYVLGIESNGDIKGCPSLPSHPYVKGNIRQESLQNIWEQKLGFARNRGTSELWGHCKGCYYAEVCQGGCSWTSHTLLGKRGNMPYCYHRADMLAQKGLCEVLRQNQKADGQPFDYGRFELVERPLQDFV